MHTHLATDPFHCGSCEVACAEWLQVRDFAGKIIRVSRDGGDAMTLAIARAEAIAVSDAGVFWQLGPVVSSVPLGGGASRTAATSMGNIGTFVADATTLAWTTIVGDVVTQRIGAGTPTVLAAASVDPVGPDGARAVAIDGANVYFVTGDARVIKIAQRRPTSPLDASGGATILATLPPPRPFEDYHRLTAIAVDSVNVYFIDRTARTVLQVPVGGGATSVAFEGGTVDGGGPSANEFVPLQLASDGTELYVTGALHTFVSGAPIPGTGALLKVSIARGLATTLATGLPIPSSLAVDDAGAYVAAGERDGAVFRVALGGGAPTTILRTIRPPVIAAHGGSVYVATNDISEPPLPLTPGICRNAICDPCPPASSLCFGYCTELEIDPNNCGVCGTICAAGRACLNGVCVAAHADGG